MTRYLKSRVHTEEPREFRLGGGGQEGALGREAGGGTGQKFLCEVPV